MFPEKNQLPRRLFESSPSLGHKQFPDLRTLAQEL